MDIWCGIIKHLSIFLKTKRLNAAITVDAKVLSRMDYPQMAESLRSEYHRFVDYVLIMSVKYTTKTERPIVSMYTVESGTWALSATRRFGKRLNIEGPPLSEL
jgi:hypothetical protein